MAKPLVEVTTATSGDEISTSISLEVKRKGRSGWIKSEAKIQILPDEQFDFAVIRAVNSCAEALPQLHSEFINMIEETA